MPTNWYTDKVAADTGGAAKGGELRPWSSPSDSWIAKCTTPYAA